MFEEYKFWLAIIAIAMTFYAYIPYFIGIFKGITKPHAFTWIVWFIVTFIAVFVQLVEGDGMGSWPTITAAAICFFVTLLSFKYGSRDIKRIDFVSLIGSLSVIPLWLITDNPALAVLLVTGIEIVAAFPTIRKSWSKPYEEVMMTYGLNTVRYILSAIALASYSIATIAYPLGMVLMNGIIFGVLFMRRHVTSE